MTLLAPELCPRYAARLILGVTVGPSPLWLRQRLESVGLRSINNIVDITNFVLLESGQPLHAFDYDLLAENRIVVRAAACRRTLHHPGRGPTGPFLRYAGDCRRKPGRGPGRHHGRARLGNQERDPERAAGKRLFQPTVHPAELKKLGLSTEASMRFERGVDLEGILPAADRAAQLMAELGGGAVVPGVVDQYPRPLSPRRPSPWM